MSDSLIEIVASNIARGCSMNPRDPFVGAAQRLFDRQMLTSPERTAGLLDSHRIVLIEGLRDELTELEQVARTKDPEQRAGMLLVIRAMRVHLTRVGSTPVRAVTPEMVAASLAAAREAMARLVAEQPTTSDDAAGGAR